MSVGAAGPLVVTYPLSERSRAIVAEELGGAAAAVYLADLAPPERAAALRGAGALLAHDTSKPTADHRSFNSVRESNYYHPGSGSSGSLM